MTNKQALASAIQAMHDVSLALAGASRPKAFFRGAGGGEDSSSVSFHTLSGQVDIRCEGGGWVVSVRSGVVQ